LLPYLDENNLYNGNQSIGNSSAPLEYRLQFDHHGKGMVSLLPAIVKVYQCPSRGGARIFTLRSEALGFAHPFPYPPGPNDIPVEKEELRVNPSHAKPKDTPIYVAQTDYAANGGTGVGDVNGPFAYVHLYEFGRSFIPEHGVRPARTKTFNDIVDGASQTIIFGEKLINRARMHRPQADDMFGFAASYTPGTIRWCGGPGPAPFLTPMQDFKGPKGVDAGGRFGSDHFGGAQFAFADGSVRTVSYNVNGQVFYALCVINDGQIVSESDY
jgi:prepilin-type processing-associated H-X9-DG protein